MKQQKIQGDQTIDQQELALDQEREARKGTEFQERIASQERQTAARLDAAEEREIMKLRNRP